MCTLHIKNSISSTLKSSSNFLHDVAQMDTPFGAFSICAKKQAVLASGLECRSDVLRARKTASCAQPELNDDEVRGEGEIPVSRARSEVT